MIDKICLMLKCWLILMKDHYAKRAAIGNVKAFVIIDTDDKMLDRPKINSKFDMKSQAAGYRNCINLISDCLT